MDLKIELFDSIICVLCLNHKEIAEALTSELEPNLITILCRHFWFNQEDVRQKYVCSTCWTQVQDFNEFYEQIVRIHDEAEPNCDEIEPEVLPKDDSLLFDDQHVGDEIHEPDPFLEEANMETILIDAPHEMEETIAEEPDNIKDLLTDNSSTNESSQQNDEINTRQKCKTVIPTEAHELSENVTRNESEETVSYKCDYCDRVYAKQYLLNKHRLQHERKSQDQQYHCRECGKECGSELRRQQHEKRVHGPGFMCDICSKSFKTVESLRNHQTNTHNTNVTERVECTICNRWLKNTGSLRKHLVRHRTSGKPNVCEICGKVSPTYTALKSHMMFVHQMQRSFRCTVCNKAFKRAFTLEEHMTIHTGYTLYSCPHCTKTFNSSANLHAHKKKVHPQEWEKSRLEYEKRFTGEIKS
uniref:C2H2-type domain-containing protein n=1 Tax=Anopheles epiroticus TaxID=199890 RepID=A0A182PFH6_9DIPT